MRCAPEDLELVGAAVSALRRGAGPLLHPAAAAVRTADGRVVSALALGALCAEPSAVAAALGQGGRAATLVAVRHVTHDATRVTAPCGSCRALLAQHAPGLRVVHLADGLQVSRVGELP